MQNETLALKRKLLWSGLAGVAVTWSVTLYWTLVTHGYLDTPWVI